MKHVGIILLLLASFLCADSQTLKKDPPLKKDEPKKDVKKDDRPLIQFSGVVVERDSLKPVSFAKIIIKNKQRGTLADYFGFFSFVAQEKDTIEFTAVGFKSMLFIIPDSLTTNKYSLIQIMHSDTILLKETVIYPWPSKESFKKVFLETKIPEDDLDRAAKNLDQQNMVMQYETMPMDGNMNFKASMQETYSKLYYAGQYPPNNLLNPIAWAKFIKAWKNGDFKKKEQKEIKDEE
ncbi:MAG: carboxypeptidase-like regulatory domain-containing protein [Bacteroidia bacterium]|nr:carboxypeptidase-like regulatory domain-containing protein [Bacteroidia bacterium]